MGRKSPALPEAGAQSVEPSFNMKWEKAQVKRGIPGPHSSMNTILRNVIYFTFP
jgi:hypothetical protein